MNQVKTSFMNMVECKGRGHLKKTRAGFISVAFLSFLGLIMTGFVGLSLLSMGIRNVTRVQSYCIRINLEGQKSQRRILDKILKLNDTVLFFHKTRKSLKASLIAATGAGLIHVIPTIKKKINAVKKIQQMLILRQKLLLSQSLRVKRKTFKKFKEKVKKFHVSYVQDKTFFKPALAIKRKKEGDSAYTYRPVPDFTGHQKSHFFWRINLFSPLHFWQGLLRILSLQSEGKHFPGYSCVASLQKRGNIWNHILYH